MISLIEPLLIWWKCLNPFGKYRIISFTLTDGSRFYGAATEDAWQDLKDMMHGSEGE